MKFAFLYLRARSKRQAAQTASAELQNRDLATTVASELDMHMLTPVQTLVDRVRTTLDGQHFLFDCPFYSIIRGQNFSLFGPNYQQRDIRLFFEQNAHQLGFVAHHIHLCFQARMSDESHLAPHPRL